MIGFMNIMKRAKREVLCDWYIPKIDLHIEFWEKKTRGDPKTIEIKQKFYEDHSLRAIGIYENDLQIADRMLPTRIRQVAPECKFRNLVKNGMAWPTQLVLLKALKRAKQAHRMCLLHMVRMTRYLMN